MNHRKTIQRRAYTMVELVLVVGLLVAISAITIPNFIREIEREALPGSAKQLRSLITMMRANAAFDGKRYRLRFPLEDEETLIGEHQPMIEREDDPFENPEEFVQVTAPWAISNTLLGKIWCVEVRPGHPTIEQLQRLRETRNEIQDTLIEAFDQENQDFEAQRPPLLIEPDGSSEWTTFVLTDAPTDTELDQLENFARIEVIFDGETGLAWLQRPFYESELDLFEEKNWPAVLRQDFLNPNELTEDDVLELQQVYHGYDSSAQTNAPETTP